MSSARVLCSLNGSRGVLRTNKPEGRRLAASLGAPTCVLLAPKAPGRGRSQHIGSPSLDPGQAVRSPEEPTKQSAQECPTRLGSKRPQLHAPVRATGSCT